MGCHARAVDLLGLRQLVKHLERLRPITLRLVDALEVIERCVPIFARGGELLQHPLRAVHEPGALIVESQRKGGFVGKRSAAVLAQPRVDSNGTIDLTPSAEQAAESELDLGSVTVRFGHAREDLSGVVEAVVDEMIEADVVVAWQAHRSGCAIAAAEKPGGQPYEDEGQRKKQWRQFEHS